LIPEAKRGLGWPEWQYLIKDVRGWWVYSHKKSVQSSGFLRSPLKAIALFVCRTASFFALLL
jgi:hypothetical protein